MNASFALICVVFTGFHIFYLVGGGKTTLEFCEKKGNKDHPYNFGIWKNFTRIFGKNPIFWFFPYNTINIDINDMEFVDNQKNDYSREEKLKLTVGS